MFCYIVLGSDVIYSESAVMDLLSTITQLCGGNTTIFLAGELRNGNFYISILKFSFCMHFRECIEK